MHLLDTHPTVQHKVTPIVIEVVGKCTAYQARSFTKISAPLPVALPLVVLSKGAFPLKKCPVVSHSACKFEVRLGLTLQKGLKDIVSDEHEHLSGGERKTSNMSVSLPQAAIAMDEQHRAYARMAMPY